MPAENWYLGASRKVMIDNHLDDWPVYDLAVRFRAPAGKQVKQVTLQPEGIALRPTQEGGWSRVIVLKIEVRSAVVIEWAGLFI